MAPPPWQHMLFGVLCVWGFCLCIGGCCFVLLLCSLRLGLLSACGCGPCDVDLLPLSLLYEQRRGVRDYSATILPTMRWSCLRFGLGSLDCWLLVLSCCSVCCLFGWLAPGWLAGWLVVVLPVLAFASGFWLQLWLWGLWLWLGVWLLVFGWWHLVLCACLVALGVKFCAWRSALCMRNPRCLRRGSYSSRCGVAFACLLLLLLLALASALVFSQLCCVWWGGLACVLCWHACRTVVLLRIALITLGAPCNM